MRSSKKRDLKGKRMRGLHVMVDEDCYDKLSRMAGPESLGEAAERVIRFGFARWEKKHYKSKETIRISELDVT